MSRERPIWILPLAVAVALRGAQLVIDAVRDPLFLEPVIDAWFHTFQATQILERGWLIEGAGAYYKGPLYSYVLAVLFSVFGPTAGIVVARILAAAAGCASVVLVTLVAQRAAGRRAGTIAGLVAAVYGTAIYFDTSLLLVPYVTLAVLFAAERMARSLDEPRPERSLLEASVALGVGTLVRANVLLAVIAGAIWAVRRTRSGAWSGLGPARAVALLVVPALLVVSPATLRNAVVEGDPVLVSWNGGINLFIGNDPAFDQGSGNWHPDLSWTRLYEAPSDLGLTRGSEHQRFFVEQAVRAALDAPWRTAGIVLEKVGWLLSPYEISNNRRLGEARERSPILAVLLVDAPLMRLPFAVVLPALVLAAFAMPSKARAVLLPAALLALALAAAPLLTFNTARFRLPVVMLLLPVVGAGWAAIAAWPKARRALAAAGVLVAAVALSLAAGIGLTPPPALPPSDVGGLADVALRSGDREGAIELWRRAAEREPDDPTSRIRLADLLRSVGRCEEALEHYRHVEGTEGLAAEWKLAALRSRARCLVMLDRTAEALPLFQRFLDADPDAPTTDGRPDFHLRDVPPLRACRIRKDLALAYRRLGRDEAAAAELARIVRDCADAPRIAGEAQRALAQMAGSRQRPRAR